eukprot:SAG31_NODE_9857_length_1208_cov_22.150893_1_plen_172_part_00
MPYISRLKSRISLIVAQKRESNTPYLGLMALGGAVWCGALRLLHSPRAQRCGGGGQSLHDIFYKVLNYKVRPVRRGRWRQRQDQEAQPEASTPRDRARTRNATRSRLSLIGWWPVFDCSTRKSAAIREVPRESIRGAGGVGRSAGVCMARTLASYGKLKYVIPPTLTNHLS